MDFQAFIFLIEMIGTLAFASSGAMLGIHKRMDIFGVCVLGVTTSVGGGLIRDLILGITPPGMFQNPVYAGIAVLVSVLLFLLIYIDKRLLHGSIALAYDRIMLVFDTFGLGIFTVVGVSTAISAGYTQKFLLLFVGVITGVGGGLLRDMMAQEKPYILNKHIYACASIVGALVMIYAYPVVGQIHGMMAGAWSIVIIRFLAAYFHWNLPKISVDSDGSSQA